MQRHRTFSKKKGGRFPLLEDVYVSALSKKGFVASANRATEYWELSRVRKIPQHSTPDKVLFTILQSASCAKRCFFLHLSFEFQKSDDHEIRKTDENEHPVWSSVITSLSSVFFSSFPFFERRAARNVSVYLLYITLCETLTA